MSNVRNNENDSLSNVIIYPRYYIKVTSTL